MLFKVSRQLFSRIDELLEFGVSDIASDDQGAIEFKARLDGIFRERGQYLGHRLVQVDCHCLTRGIGQLLCSSFWQEVGRLAFKLF